MLLKARLSTGPIWTLSSQISREGNFPSSKFTLRCSPPYPLFPELSFLLISNSRFPGEIIDAPRNPWLFLNNLQYPSSISISNTEISWTVKFLDILPLFFNPFVYKYFLILSHKKTRWDLSDDSIFFLIWIKNYIDISFVDNWNLLPRKNVLVHIIKYYWKSKATIIY